MIEYLEERMEMEITLKQKNVSPKMDLELSSSAEAKLRDKRADEFGVWQLAHR